MRLPNRVSDSYSLNHNTLSLKYSNSFYTKTDDNVNNKSSTQVNPTSDGKQNKKSLSQTNNLSRTNNTQNSWKNSSETSSSERIFHNSLENSWNHSSENSFKQLNKLNHKDLRRSNPDIKEFNRQFRGLSSAPVDTRKSPVGKPQNRKKRSTSKDNSYGEVVNEDQLFVLDLLCSDNLDYEISTLTKQQAVRTNGIAYVGGTMLDSPCGTPPNMAQQDFIPYGHVSRPGSTPQSYSLWGSSEEGSRTDSDEHLYRKNFGRSLCRVVTGCGIMLVILALLGIVGIAVYLGYISNQDDGPSHTSRFVGSLNILHGDSWVPDLSNPSSPSFRAKASKYKNMLESVYEHSSLGKALEKAEVKKFDEIKTSNGVQINFVLSLDRRKIPFWRMKNTEKDLHNILEQELRSPSPVAFENVEVNIDDLSIKSAEIKSKAQLFEDNSQEKLELVTVGGAGAILRVKSSDLNRIKDFEEMIDSSEVKTTATTTASTPTSTPISSSTLPPPPPTTSTSSTILTTSKSPVEPSTIRNLIYEYGPWKPIDPSKMFDAIPTNPPSRPVLPPSQETSIDFSDLGEIPVIEGVRYDYNEEYPDYRYDDYDINRNGTVMFFPPLPLPPPVEVKESAIVPTIPATTQDFVQIQTTSTPLSLPPPSTFPPMSSPTLSPSSTIQPLEEIQTISSDAVREFLRTLFTTQSTTSPTESVNRVGFFPSTTEAYLAENRIEGGSPSQEDIQAVLENLLFLATIKPNYFTEEESKIESKESVDTKVNLKQNLRGENKNWNNLEVKVETLPPTARPDVLHVTSYSGVRDFKKPSSKPIGPLPVDKFRINAQTATDDYINLSYEQKTTTSKPDRFNIWDILTTRKPLILDTEVITSTSFDVRYGSTTEDLRPVYIHSSTISNLNNILNSNQGNENQLTIPIISGNEVRYIRVNRTKPKYPNVVVVNIPSDNVTDSESQSPRDLKNLKLNSKFINDLTKLLAQFQNKQPTTNSPKTNHREGKSFSAKQVHSGKAINSLWSILSNLNKVYMSNPAISQQLYDFATSTLQPNYLQTNSASNFKPQKYNNKKRGKSLHIKPITTLYITKGVKDRNAKVLSIAGQSGGSIHSVENSPIHTFTFKEGQSLEELLTEIFDELSRDDEMEVANSNTEGFDKSDNILDNEFELSSSTVPAGEDSLKIIEELSKLLSNRYDNYNMVFGSQNEDEDHDHVEETTKNIFVTTIEDIATTPLLDYNESINEVESTTTLEPQLNKFKNVTQTTYFKYYHDLFPVMTRPMNPIKTTPPSRTSLEVSYSIKSDSHENSLMEDGSMKNCTENQFKCGSGKCIPLMAKCNMVRDCKDNSDESKCKCSDILISQHYSRKICDGIIDCWDKSDEINCDWCSPGHFICTGSKMCVEPEKVCDAVSDCPNGDDERDCVTIAPNLIDTNTHNYFDEGYLMVRKKGLWGKLCVDNFENAISKASVSWTVSDLGEAVCNTLSYDSSSDVKKTHDPTPPISRSTDSHYFELNIARDLDEEDSQLRGLGRFGRLSIRKKRNSPVEGAAKKALDQIIDFLEIKNKREKRDTNDLTLQFKSTDCINKDVVKVKCKDLQCGVRPRAITQQARIVGGSNSSPGAWPWHAALYKEGEYQCGATLISEKWLISAGHCFYGAKLDYWVARMGALRRGTKFPTPFEQVRSISHIFIHPEYVNHGFINDITMLRLAQPATLNDYVRPVCLPSPGSEVNDGQSCTLVGWGQLFEIKKVFPDTLQEVEVPLISTKECRKRTIFLPLYRITEDMFCAGYDRGGRDACLGDSGGPLMCQKSDGQWEVLGVTSNGYGCARPHRPGVYTKVVNYLPWIDQVMELSQNNLITQVKNECQGHRCPLGQCLPPSGVCNGRIECSDGSDEVNCS